MCYVIPQESDVIIYMTLPVIHQIDSGWRVINLHDNRDEGTSSDSGHVTREVSNSQICCIMNKQQQTTQQSTTNYYMHEYIIHVLCCTFYHVNVYKCACAGSCANIERVHSRKLFCLQILYFYSNHVPELVRHAIRAVEPIRHAIRLAF